MTHLSRARSALAAIVSEMVATSPRETAVGAVLLLVLTATEGLGLLLLAPLLELIGVVEDNPLPQAAGWLATALAAVGAQPTLGTVLLVFVSVAAVRAALQRSQSLLGAAVRENLANAYRTRVYRAMAAAQWQFLSTRTPSEFVRVLTNEAGRLGVAATRVIDLAVTVAATTVYIALALRLAPEVTALVLGSAGVLAWGVRRSLTRAAATGAVALVTKARLHTAVADHVASLKVARAYGAIERHTAAFDELSTAAGALNIQSTAGETDLRQSLELGSTILLAALVYVAATIAEISPALLLVLLYVFARLMPRLVMIYRHLQGLVQVLPVFEAVTRLERDCLEAAEPAEGPRLDLAPLADHIRCDGVSFDYARRGETAALDRVDLRIDAGRTTAIVGPSGSGKSTLADLLLGLLVPTQGRILVDGCPLTESHLSAWRRQVGYVAQETFLFNDTVRANLVWARPEASDEQVWTALRLAAAEQFVRQLPQGLDTPIGQRGALVSGGERQRLSIARALLRQPRILVLDEATSSLDTEHELRIQEAIDGLQHRMTIVIITHRLSTIRHADVIHVLDQGRLVQSGNWATLQAARGGRFHALAKALDAEPASEGA